MCHERAAITTAIPCCTLMCEIKQYYYEEHCVLCKTQTELTHREAAPRRMLRDDDDVRQLLTVITSGPMTDPFSLDEDAVCSYRTSGQLFEIGTARSDNKVCGTETDYQQHNVLGFPPKS